MPLFQPFRALRYADTLPLDLVTTPPYDIISPEEQKALEALHPNNFVRIVLGSQLPRDRPGQDRYSRAAAYLEEWIEQKVLVADDEPSFWLYTMDHDSQTTAGLIGALQLETLGAGGVYPHEQTTPGPKADRLELMRATSANLEPLWFFASRPIKGFKEFTEQVMAGPPEMDVAGSGNVRHRAFRVTGDEAANVVERINKTPVVVADGHHRYETAITYRDERRSANGSGPWDATLALIMDPSVHPPSLRPIHRIATKINFDDLSEAVDLLPFSIQPETLPAEIAKEGPGSIGVAAHQGVYKVNVSGELDTAYLAHLLESLGADVTYEHESSRVLAAVGSGSIGFLLAPPALDLVAKSALAGERMPPKTTLFWPKPRSGMVMRGPW